MTHWPTNLFRLDYDWMATNQFTRAIAVLFHASLPANHMPAYRTWHLANAWRDAGHVVRFLTDPGSVCPSDILIPQVDLSVMPPDYRQVLARTERVVNRHVTDIRKSTFSEIRITAVTPYEGPVIVKTDLNYGGKPELRLAGDGGAPGLSGHCNLESL